MLYGTITEFCTPDEVFDPATFDVRLAEPLSVPGNVRWPTVCYPYTQWMDVTLSTFV